MCPGSSKNFICYLFDLYKQPFKVDIIPFFQETEGLREIKDVALGTHLGNDRAWN